MSDQLTVTPAVLEPAAQAFADATADPPYLFEPGLVEVPGGPSGKVSARIMRPRGATGPPPVVIHIHGFLGARPGA